jgi:hypothetical protein
MTVRADRVGGGGEPVAARVTGQWGTGAKPWESSARAVKEWTEFLAEHGVGLFDSRDRLKAGLSR